MALFSTKRYRPHDATCCVSCATAPRHCANWTPVASRVVLPVPIELNKHGKRKRTAMILAGGLVTGRTKLGRRSRPCFSGTAPGTRRLSVRILMGLKAR